MMRKREMTEWEGKQEGKMEYEAWRMFLGRGEEKWASNVSRKDEDGM